MSLWAINPKSVFSILERYIARAVLRTTLLTILALAFMLVFFTFVDKLDEVQQDQYDIFDAFKMALYSVPNHLFEAFPVAALIGGLLGLGGLANHSEIVAMRAGGFALKSIVYAVLKVGLIMVIFILLVGEWLAPLTAQYAQQLRLAKQEGQIMSMSGEGFWARDGDQYVNIERIMSGTHLQGVTLFEFDENGRLSLNSRAATADYQDGQWLLEDIQQSFITPSQITTEQATQMRWESILDPALLSVVMVKPDKLPVWDLYRYINFMQSNGQSAIGYRAAFWSKVATPILGLLMLLLAVPFALVKQRSGTGQRILIGAIIGALFFLLMRSVSYASVVYDLNPLLLMCVPVLMCLSMIVWLMRRVR